MTTKEYIESSQSWQLSFKELNESLDYLGFSFDNHISKSNDELKLLELRKSKNLPLTEENEGRVESISMKSIQCIDLYNIEKNLSNKLIFGYERLHQEKEKENNYRLAQVRVNEKIETKNKLIEDLKGKISYVEDFSSNEINSFKESYTRFLNTIDKIADKVMAHDVLDIHKESLRSHLESLEGVRFEIAIKGLRKEYENLVLEIPVLKTDTNNSIRSSSRLKEQMDKVKSYRDQILSIEKEIKLIEDDNEKSIKTLDSYRVSKVIDDSEFTWMTEGDYKEAVTRNGIAKDMTTSEDATLSSINSLNNSKTNDDKNSEILAGMIGSTTDITDDDFLKKLYPPEPKKEKAEIKTDEIIGGFGYPNLIKKEEDPAMKKWYKYLQDLYMNQGKGFKIDKNNITNFKIVFKNPITNLTTVKESVVQLNHSFSCKSSPVFAIGRKTYQAFSEGVRLLAGTIVVNAFDNVPLAHLHSISYSENAYIEDLPPIDLYIIPIEPLADGRYETLKITGMKFIETKQTDGASSNGRFYAFDFVAENFEPMDFQKIY